MSLADLLSGPLPLTLALLGIALAALGLRREALLRRHPPAAAQELLQLQLDVTRAELVAAQAELARYQRVVPQTWLENWEAW